MSTSHLLGAALVGSWALGASAAPAGAATSASSLAPEEDLAEDQITFDQARGLQAYVALREIWDHWEDADPKRVEAALELARTSPRHAEPVRVYAGVLAAYARMRRGDLAAARRILNEEGFVRNWLVLGPFDNEGKGGLARQDGPDVEVGAPIVGGRAYSGKERPVRWRELPAVFPYGWVDLGTILRPQTHICGFATTFVEGGQTPRNITIWVGSSGAFRLLFNGQKVLEQAAYRGFDVDRQGTTVRLVPGQNRLSIKVCGADAAPVFSVRLADDKGKPDARLQAKADIPTSVQSEEVVKQVLARRAPLPQHPPALQGPLDEVAASFAAKKPAAEALEAAARYLVLTSGDDEATHQARELAERAVGAQPTPKRLLLAA